MNWTAKTNPKTKLEIKNTSQMPTYDFTVNVNRLPQFSMRTVNKRLRAYQVHKPDTSTYFSAFYANSAEKYEYLKKKEGKNTDKIRFSNNIEFCTENQPN